MADQWWLLIVMDIAILYCGTRLNNHVPGTMYILLSRPQGYHQIRLAQILTLSLFKPLTICKLCRHSTTYKIPILYSVMFSFTFSEV